ncbi:U3 small nucleolar RNA-associated protein 4-like [Hondaea fermentalgiana]|uniref:U3 small nucleolar RNA-associated protein 4-like n=1 Tax=Hondaea fermentalgiana TaxID=2315210 RepID=A0A2R5GL99_9STRA|nr:U3 small nucleolar RNA-associated protein 4-like [Hondaea fermentalgiana]|eukprot:GBG31657.1 U3 small nucleolar RNA-associated protein 4-like [Hondaea fermentalgiana]
MVQTRRRAEPAVSGSPAKAPATPSTSAKSKADKAKSKTKTGAATARKASVAKPRRSRAASEDLASEAVSTNGHGPDSAIMANGTSKSDKSTPRKRSLSNASGSADAGAPSASANGVGKKRSRSGSINGTTGVTHSADLQAKQEFQVQRCRFMNWVPFSITSMKANLAGSQLALTRENGAVEVWNIDKQAWHQAIHVPGREEPGFAGTTLSMAWVGNERLFGSDMDGNVFEIDMRRQARVRETSSFGGAVWCMDSSTEEVTSQSDEAGSEDSERAVVAMGCEDGRVRIFEVLPGQGAGLEYARAFRSVATGRVLAIKYHPAPEQRHVLYTAGVDGLIRKWDARTGQVILQIATESYGKVEPICVWTLEVLKDSTLFSGDSDGHVHVWDSRDEAGTLIRGFHEHRADVTTLAVSKDETTLFASGIDSRVAMFHRIDATDGSGVQDWVYGYSHRPHSRDVRGLAIVDNGRILASGGDDTQICWYPVRSFSKARPTRLSPFLHQILVQPTCRGSLLLAQHAHHVELWQSKTQNHLASLHFKGRMGLRCAALAPSGRLLLCADDAGLKVFSLRSDEAVAGGDVSLKRLNEVEQRLQSREAGVSARADGVVVAACVASPTLSPEEEKDGKELLVYAFQSGRVCVAHILGSVQNSDMLTCLVSWDPLWDGAAIKEVVVSDDGRWVAVASAGGQLAVYDVQLKKLQMEIPRASLGGALCSALRFQPDSPGILAVATMRNEVFVFDVQGQKLTPWSLAAAGRMDPLLREQHEPVIGITFDKADPSVMILWGRCFACKVSLATLPHALEAHESGTLRFSMLTRFKPIIHMDFVDEHEILVVEALWIKVMQTFKDPIKRKIYGGAT